MQLRGGHGAVRRALHDASVVVPTLLAVIRTDFYLATSAVIPILALTRIAGERIELEPLNEQAAEFRARAVPTFAYLAVALTWAFPIWGEFICLRTLQTGHVPWGGSVVIWLTLALQVSQIVAASVGRQPVWMINRGFRMMYHGVTGKHAR
jgi:hypothetical protein